MTINIKDEPTPEQVNEMAGNISRLYMQFAFDAIVNKDQEKARGFLQRLDGDQLEDLAAACQELRTLIYHTFFNTEREHE